MSTRPTFEDRLLGELKREIELREPEPTSSARRLFTSRRIAVVTAACALAGLAVVFVPGSAADSKAYAVERHDDGSVTLTIKDRRIDIETQHELARQMRPWGIQVEVTCASKSWGTDAALELTAINEQGAPERLVTWSTTLDRGSKLVLENTAKPVTRDEIKRHEVKRCVPGKLAPPDNSPTD
ncbi:hypothetical protein GCM10023080_018880 [Streptomyces pseudoechinosporeus]